MLFPSQCEDSSSVKDPKSPQIFTFQEPVLENKLDYQESEPFQDQFEDNGLDESSFDSAMYSIEECKLMCQRNRHYCNDSLMRKFKRLVRVDFGELYFTPLIVLDNISDEVGC